MHAAQQPNFDCEAEPLEYMKRALAVRLAWSISERMRRHVATIDYEAARVQRERDYEQAAELNVVPAFDPRPDTKYVSHHVRSNANKMSDKQRRTRRAAKIFGRMIGRAKREN